MAAIGRVSIASHASTEEIWRIASLSLERRLAPFVRRLHAYGERQTRFTRRRELPNGLATLVLNLGAELRIEHPLKVRAAFSAGTGFYSGPSTTYAGLGDRWQSGRRASDADPAGRASFARDAAE